MNRRISTFRANAGFSLIELMIVLAIIGVLVTFSFPVYRDYIARTQVTVALEEITPAKINIEEKFSHGVDSFEMAALNGNGAANAQGAGLSGNITSRCTGISFAVEMTGTASITCTLSGDRQIDGSKIRWSRAPNTTPGAISIWTCDTNVAKNISPKNCNSNIAIF